MKKLLIITILIIAAFFLLLSFFRNSTSATKKKENIAFSCKDSYGLEKSLGQLFFLGFYGQDLSPQTIKWIQERNLGGVVIFGRNVKDSAQLIALIKKIKKINSNQSLVPSIPVFIATDHEPGSFMSIRVGTKFPNLSVVKKNKISFRKMNHAMANDLAQWGFTMNFHPVIDVKHPAKKSPLDYRIYSSNPDEVAEWGIVTKEIFWQKGIIAVAKHFPDHGSTEIDSHYALPVIHNSLVKLNKRDLIPFRAFVHKGGKAIMLAHILYSSIDPQYPATLSANIIQNIVRKELGFNGLIITDDMTMLALVRNFSPIDAAYRAIMAGADMLLYTQLKINKSSVEQIYQAIVNQARHEEKLRAQIESTCSHIVNQKIEIFGLMKNH